MAGVEESFNRTIHMFVEGVCIWIEYNLCVGGWHLLKLQARQAHQGGLGNLGDPGGQGKKDSVRTGPRQSFPISPRDLSEHLTCPHPHPPFKRPKPRVVYDDILDTYRCARGTRETTRTRRTLQKGEKKRAAMLIPL